MRSLKITGIGIGFLVAAFLAFAPPIVFLAIPAAGFFILLLPLWAIATTIIAFAGFLLSGRPSNAIGVALFAAAAALSPFGTLASAGVHAALQVIAVQRMAQPIFDAACAKDYIPLASFSGNRPGRIVFDAVNIPYAGYDPADVVAVLTGMEVLEIHRRGSDDFLEAWKTTADQSASCKEGWNSSEVQVTVRGPQLAISPLKIDRCLRRSKIADPSRDQTPALILKNGPNVGGYCSAIDVVERAGGRDVLLGRVHYDGYNQRLFPHLMRPDGNVRSAWFFAVLGKILGEEISENSLMRYASEKS